MGQKVSESVDSFLNSIDNGNYNSATLILDEVLSTGGVEDFSTTLERVSEKEGGFSNHGLKIRDCFADYLGFGPVYFALLILMLAMSG